MRVLEANICKAIDQGRNLKSSNTEVYHTGNGGFVVKLYGHTIWQTDEQGKSYMFACGWETNTTKSRLNALLYHLIGNTYVYQERHTWYVKVGRSLHKEPFYEGIELPLINTSRPIFNSIRYLNKLVDAAR